MPNNLVYRFKPMGKSPLILFFIISQPFSCCDKSVVFGFFNDLGIVESIMNFPVNDLQFVIDLSRNFNFFNHGVSLSGYINADRINLSYKPSERLQIHPSILKSTNDCKRAMLLCFEFQGIYFFLNSIEISFVTPRNNIYEGT
jgi:hypothetical protein